LEERRRDLEAQVLLSCRW